MAKKRKRKTAKTPVTPACSACSYWVTENVADDVSGADQGHCRRFPPMVSAPGSGPWPITLATDWCGEFKSA